MQWARFALPRSAQVVDLAPSRAAKRYVRNVFSVSHLNSRNVAYVIVSDPFSLPHAPLRAETCVGVGPGDRALLELASRSTNINKRLV